MAWVNKNSPENLEQGLGVTLGKTAFPRGILGVTVVLEGKVGHLYRFEMCFTSQPESGPLPILFTSTHIARGTKVI